MKLLSTILLPPVIFKAGRTNVLMAIFTMLAIVRVYNFLNVLTNFAWSFLLHGWYQ